MRLAASGRMFVAALAVVITGQLLAARLAGGQQPSGKLEFQIKLHGDGIPFLNSVPYIGRLFSHSHGQATRMDEPGRLAIDFNIDDHTDLNDFIELLKSPPAGPFDDDDCRVCSQAIGNASSDACRSRSCRLVTANERCAAAKCGADAKCCADATRCAAECCEAGTCVAGTEKSELWEHVAELAAEKAALEASLEGYEAVLEARQEMFDAVVKLTVEKARLEAKLEMVEHRDGLLKELVELQAENARLKAQAEVAQQKEELMTSQLGVMLENERLKQRVAELEQRQGAGDEPVLAAKKAGKAKKTR